VAYILDFVIFPKVSQNILVGQFFSCYHARIAVYGIFRNVSQNILVSQFFIATSRTSPSWSYFAMLANSIWSVISATACHTH